MRFSRDEDPSALQAVEDALWEVFKPMLGRKGAR
jgi:hypothetical protein